MKVVPFGLNTSPFLLNVVIRRQASHSKDQFPVEADILDRSMYVDDLTGGADTEKEVVTQSENIKSILQKAQLPLVKWVSSSKVISQALKEKGFHMRYESEDELPVTKILGLYWNPNSDIITYGDLQTEKIYTKRDLCSMLASVFDPLRLIAPAVLKLKLLMQQTWIEKVGWDDVLNEDFQLKIKPW
uniref:Reverse transcriptase domain-containing protein n=1 Tax=Strigamia maritima TaxID=126957 RepID=T1ILW4_STRMM